MGTRVRRALGLLVGAAAMATAACSATAPSTAPGPTVPGVPVGAPGTSTAGPSTAGTTAAPGTVAQADQADQPGTTLPGDRAAATTVAVPTTPLATTSPPQPVTIAFGGDVHGEAPIAGVLARGDNPLASVAGLLGGADLAMVNLETTVGSSGRAQDKEFTFQADPSLLDALVDAGVDVVSVANNHSFDFGRDAFLETLDQIGAHGLQAVGGGRDATAAYAPAVFDVRGTLVAFVGIAKVGPDDGGRATATRPGTTNGRDVAATLAAVRAARAITPVVIVMLHWGIELDQCPQHADRDLAHQLLDAGATVVVGAHPHVLQGWEQPAGRLVAYSMGNFVFYARNAEPRRTGVLTVTIDPRGSVLGTTFDPARIDGEGRPVLLGGDERDQALADLDALRIGGPVCP